MITCRRTWLRLRKTGGPLLDRSISGLRGGLAIEDPWWHSWGKQTGFDGQARVALQAARLHLPVSEIYGGTGSVWDYGPLGVELKKNVKDAGGRRWSGARRHRGARRRDPHASRASGKRAGTSAGFTDPLVDCRTARAASAPTSSRIKGSARRSRAQCPAAARRARSPSRGSSTSCSRRSWARSRRRAGRVPAPGDGAGHLRELPERAAVDAAEGAVRHRADRQGVPQRDHAGELHLPHARVRADGDAVLRRAGHGRWSGSSTGRPSGWNGTRARARAERLRYHQHEDELAHYARAAFDIEFDFGGTLGFQEIEGIHNRGDFDLAQHQEYSGKKLEYFDQPNNKRYVPFVVETSVGRRPHDARALVNAYREEEVEGETKGARCSAPSVARADQGGVFALVKKDGMPEMAHRIANDLRRHSRFYDETGASASATAGRTRSGRRSASRSTASLSPS
jgi:glycyl-tRNA synthetase